jgi:alpha-D-ribose 1-methylphosphonate 5-triphosphate synthase subunit PhnL
MTLNNPSIEATTVLTLAGVSKHFTLHHQHGTVLPVFDHIDLEVQAGECLVLDGPSGMGKSTLLKLVYANYRASSGDIWVCRGDGARINLTQAEPRELVALRRDTIGYVSQFLRVIPRVPTLDVVAEALIEDANGDMAVIEAARDQARQWLARLQIPERLWSLPPATFSGGEQQRVNIARNMIKPRPLLLLDEPTASLDAANTSTVIKLICEARERGCAILGIFHDHAVAKAVATRRVPVETFRHTTLIRHEDQIQGEPA